MEHNAYNETSYEWRSNQHITNYNNSATEPVTNRPTTWSNTQGTVQWTANQQTTQTQMQNQENYGYVQQTSVQQPPYFQQVDL